MLRRFAFAGSLLMVACSSTYVGPGNGVGAGSGTGASAGRGEPATPQAGRDRAMMPSFPFNPGGGGSSGSDSFMIPPDLPPAMFSVSVKEYGAVMLTTMSPQPLYIRTCSNSFTLEKADGGGWVELQDDRPLSYDNPGYYLDGRYIEPSHNLGCDYVTCKPLAYEENAGRALEYLRTGLAAPPSGADQIATIESRGLRGKMRVRVSYFEDPACTKAQTVSVHFEVPQGLCCAIGLGECSGFGRVGGWAATSSTCTDERTAADAYYAYKFDPWGCPILVYDENICCNCQPDDAGVEF